MTEPTEEQKELIEEFISSLQDQMVEQTRQLRFEERVIWTSGSEGSKYSADNIIKDIKKKDAVVKRLRGQI